MIKEALEYIVGLSRPELVEKDGSVWSDRRLSRVNWNPKAQPIEMSTLTSLIDYIKSKTDAMDNMIVHVVSPLEVRLFSALDKDRVRETLVAVEGQVPDFKYGQYINHEEFLIALQSKFLDSEERAGLLAFVGNVENGSVSSYGDDGVSQKATVKTGVVSREDKIVPNPVKLRPFRTFVEAEQPASDFVFRMRDDGRGGVQCAIFEADGGAWKNCAMESIKDYLKQELEEFKNFTIIS